MAQSYHRSQRLIIAVIVGKAAHGSRLPPGTSPISKLNRTWNWLRSKTGGQRAGGRRPGEGYRQRSQRRHREPAGAVGRQPPCQTPGCAASRDTQVVIRVSSGFWQWHLGILDWLDKAGVEIYAIEVSAWRIGDTVAPHFELVAGSGARLKRAEKGAGTAHVAYGRFFRPLTRQLRGHWFQPMGGRQGGGPVGTAPSAPGTRSGRSTTFSKWVMTTACRGPGSMSKRMTIRPSSRHCMNIGSKLTLRWKVPALSGLPARRERYSWVGMSTEGFLDEQEERPEEIRVWMLDSLARLRAVLQPRLDMVMDGWQADS